MTNALVTASADGIGLAIAKRLMADGASVMLSDLPDSPGERRAAEIGARWMACDLRDFEAIEALVDAAGPLDILVNNGGIAGPTAPAIDIDVATFREVMDVNVNAMFAAARAALPAMIERGSGVVVNLSSVAGRVGYPNRSPYCASKAAVLGLTAALAQEVGGAGVRVNAILPGSVAGARIERVIEGYSVANKISRQEAEASILTRQALPRFIEAEEIADMVAYLASDAARSITGQFIGVDGGFI